MNPKKTFEDLEEMYEQYVAESPAVILSLEYSFRNSRLASQELKEGLLQLLECLKLSWKAMHEILIVLKEKRTDKEREELLGMMNSYFMRFVRHSDIIKRMMENNPVGEERIPLSTIDIECVHSR